MRKYILYILSGCCLLCIFAYLIWHKNNADISELYTIVNDKEENFRLCIKSRRGKVIFNEEYIGEPEIGIIYDDTFLVRRGKGDWHSYTFINVVTGLVSEEFDDISAWNHEKVVYGTYENGIIKIIVRDIYDKEKYYLEILRDYAPVAVPHHVILNAEFINDAQLMLEYYVGENMEDVSEIINLY